jgi:hypothetical protein
MRSEGGGYKEESGPLYSCATPRPRERSFNNGA